jgi:predicted transcriptional regulator
MVTLSRNSDPPSVKFAFFTNHAHVLFLIARESDARMRELAAEVGITERAVQRIVEDLTTTGYLLVTKEGRRNHYQIQCAKPLRHHVEAHRSVGDLIRFIYPEL